MKEEVKPQSVLMRKQILEQTIATDKRMKNGFTPQCSATTDSNCSAHSKFVKNKFTEICSIKK